jgi:hypothetical protein
MNLQENIDRIKEVMGVELTLEQKVATLPRQNPLFGQVILANKKFLGLPADMHITSDYISKVNNVLAKKNVSTPQRTFMGSLVGLIPIYEKALDIESIVDGILTNNTAKFNGGVLGVAAPVAYEAVVSLLDVVNEKLQGKQKADYDVKAREGIVNMGQREREELFKRYGYGGYDKWVKAGKPKL